MLDNRHRVAASGPAKRGMRLAVLLAIACSLLAAFAATAFAANYDMRGEWSTTMTASHNPSISGTGLIDKMEANGEFSGSGSFLGGIVPFTVSGTVSGNETSYTSVSESPYGQLTFIATKIQINTTENKFSGQGTYYNAKGEAVEPGEVISSRIKTYQEVIEREERERKEAEERAARLNVRGEWELTLKAGGQTAKGIALISTDANAKNEFSSSKLTFEDGVSGSFSGTLEAKNAKIKITSEAGSAGSGIPATEFTSSAISVTTASNPTSMTGSGTAVIPEFKIETTGELTATRIHNYAEVTEREAREAREAKEAQEAKEAKEAQEAKEAREAKERERRASEEAVAKRAREEREAAERSAGKVTPPPPVVVKLTLLPAVPSGNVFAGTAPLRLTNPNGFSVHGHVTVVLAGAGTSAGRKHGKPRQIVLGSASFTIAAHANKTVAVKLSHDGIATLGRRHSLRVVVTVKTEAPGATTVSKQYSLTLHARRGKA